MKLYAFAAAAAMIAAGASAQNAQTGSHNPAIKESKVHKIAAPAKGHSSFTERQAKGRITKAGYTSISDLRKNNAGAWQGKAMKGGKPVMITLDYKGNVTSR